MSQPTSTAVSSVAGAPTAPAPNIQALPVGDEHHLGLIFVASQAKTLSRSSAIANWPGLKDKVQDFPAAELCRIVVDITASEIGAGATGCICAEGAAPTVDTAAGYKSKFRFSANQANVGTTVEFEMKVGDGISSQIKPIPSNAAPLHFAIFGLGEKGVCVVIHFYWKSHGPMNSVQSLNYL